MYDRQINAMCVADDDEQSPAERRGRADWSGLIAAAMASPVFFIFVCFGKPETGFTAALALAMVIFAIRLRWNLRVHAWFWVTIAIILTLQIPLLFIVRWPQTNIPTIAFAMPIGIADFLLISGAISLAEKVFSRGPSSDEEEG
jgi:hypothetical protein